MDQPRHCDICEILLAYFIEHPSAMDTPGGILEWWLPRFSEPLTIRGVTSALEDLENRGLIERVGTVERPVFRLRQKRNE